MPRREPAERVARPFGGVGDSGIGREGGTFSREFFTEPKAVVMQVWMKFIPQPGFRPVPGQPADDVKALPLCDAGEIVCI